MLDRPLTVVGQPRVHLDIASTATDTEFWIWLYAQPPGTTEWDLVTFGAMRARYRHGTDAPLLLTPGARTTIDITLDRRVFRYPAGTWLVLEVSSAVCGQSENPNSGESIGVETVRVAATQTIFTDGPTASRLAFEVLE